MKTALITGGAGFLGRHLCARLLAEGYRVVAYDNLYTGSKENIAEFAGNPSFRFVEGDVRDLEPTLERELPHPAAFDEIYNLACPASPVHYQARPLFTARTSVFGILNCLELALRCGAKLLHASTSEVYGDALVHPQSEDYRGNVNTVGIRSCYDEGKRIAETFAADYLREHDVDVRMVRIFNTYGPFMHPQDGRVVSNFIMQALRGEDITVYGNGAQTRSFQYCDDLIEAFRRYMALDKARLRGFFRGERPPVPLINTGNPREFTIRQLAETVVSKVAALEPGRPSPRLVSRPLPGDDPRQRKPDISLAKELLDWEPAIPLSEGLDRTIGYFRKLIRR